ncbi:transporter substrate-binding domain-containing protein, partial [Burkholderia sp. SIMBA_024]|uniref:transporter substrate-binding domain-containing protein n=1 Tax=Burkholderia sp. SIMBA_024 TaxID=3085768 RepID=UPI0039781A0D
DIDVEIMEAGFDTIIPGISAGRYTMALSSIGVTEERSEVVDFVSYYRGGQGFLASANSDFEVVDLEDLCGRKVAVTT